MRSPAARLVAIGIVLLPVFSPSPVRAQTKPPSSHVVIPFLAPVAKPDDLGFEGAECDVARTGGAMTCQFQQVFLTTSDIAPDTCLVTTNRYARTFQRQAADRWVSNEGPAGDCGLLDVVTLQDGGGVRWTMTLRKVVTRNRASAACQAIVGAVETLSWQNLRRPLPCRFVQPGGLSQ